MKKTRRNPALADDIASAIASAYQPPNEWVAAVLQYFYGIRYGAPEITRIFVDRERTVRVWVRGSGDNIPLGDFKNFVQMLRSIGEAAGLDRAGIDWMLGIAQDKTTIAGSKQQYKVSGPKLIAGPQGKIQMAWETPSKVLDARNYTKEDFLDPEFPAVEQFDVPEVQPGVIEASKPWIGGRDFNGLILLRTEKDSTPELMPYLLAMDPGTSVEDGTPVVIHRILDLWGNSYWWVERKQVRVHGMHTEFLPDDLKALKWKYGATGGRTVIEFAVRWQVHENLPGWCVYFRMADGSWGWYRPEPSLILAKDEDPGEIAKSAFVFHGFESSEVVNYLK